MKKLIVGLLALCLIRLDAIAIPAYEFGNQRFVQYDADRNIFFNSSMRSETWCLGATIPMCTQPVEVPAERKLVLSLRLDLFREPQWQYVTAGTMLIGQAKAPVRRRFVGINVEANEWPEENKIWPHLGLLYVGTVAEQAGYEVKLHDELIEGKAPLDKLIKEGDVVGLSLVTTGIERGVEIARNAKALGARYVVAGNDSAIYRARQLLELPGTPIDAVFTSNSLVAIRSFFHAIQRIEVRRLNIAHVAVDPQNVWPATSVSGEVLEVAKRFRQDDYFMVPNLKLFGDEYWNQVWSAYRSQFGHKHVGSENVRNAVALFAQGCGRAGAGLKCDYCSIGHAENVMVPEQSYLEQTLEAYGAFGINTFFNVTDSAYEMDPLLQELKPLGSVDSLVMYGRAQAIALKPERLQEWLGVVKHRLLINCGMDSADERILQLGIHKSQSTKGSRVEENRKTVQIIRDAGNKAHLHYSLIFGSTGETRDSCERNLAFVQETIDILGSQLDVCESDIYWVNFGAPCSGIFDHYEEAKKRAELAGQTISRDQWYWHFGRHRDKLVVPKKSEQAWYHFFTNITYETALEYNAKVKKLMEKVPGRIAGRDYNFRPPV